jgi:ribosomal protein S18 acetylase RimI-like enzyme
MEIVRLKQVNADVDYIINNLIDKEPVRPSISHLDTLLGDDRTYLVAAKIDTQVIGYAYAHRFPSLYSSNYMAYLYDIEVAGPHRRKGAARAMITFLLAMLEKDNVVELYLGTSTDNTARQAFFANTGGVKSGETFNDFTYYLSPGD